MNVLIEALGYQIGFGFAVAKMRESADEPTPTAQMTVDPDCRCEECKPPNPVGFA